MRQSIYSLQLRAPPSTLHPTVRAPWTVAPPPWEPAPSLFDHAPHLAKKSYQNKTWKRITKAAHPLPSDREAHFEARCAPRACYRPPARLKPGPSPISATCCSILCLYPSTPCPSIPYGLPPRGSTQHPKHLRLRGGHGGGASYPWAYSHCHPLGRPSSSMTHHTCDNSRRRSQFGPSVPWPGPSGTFRAYRSCFVAPGRTTR